MTRPGFGISSMNSPTWLAAPHTPMHTPTTRSVKPPAPQAKPPVPHARPSHAVPNALHRHRPIHRHRRRERAARAVLLYSHYSPVLAQVQFRILVLPLRPPHMPSAVLLQASSDAACALDAAATRLYCCGCGRGRTRLEVASRLEARGRRTQHASRNRRRRGIGDSERCHVITSFDEARTGLL